MASETKTKGAIEKAPTGEVEPRSPGAARERRDPRGADGTPKPWAVSWLFALGVIGSVAGFGYAQKPYEMGAAATICLIGYALSRPGALLKSFRGPAGIAVEMQEAKDRALEAAEDALAAAKEAKEAAAEAKEGARLAHKRADEAHDATTALRSQVRDLAVTFAAASLEGIGHTAVMGEFPWSEKLNARDRIKDQLRALGVDEEDVKRADAPMVRHLTFQHLADALVQGMHEVGDRSGWNSNEFNAFGAQMKPLIASTRASPPVEEAKALLAGCTSPKVKEAVALLDDWLRTGEVKDRTWFDSAVRMPRVTPKTAP